MSDDYIFGVLEGVRLVAPEGKVWHLEIRQSLQGQNHQLVGCYMEEPEALALVERVPLGTPIQVQILQQADPDTAPQVHKFHAFF